MDNSTVNIFWANRELPTIDSTKKEDSCKINQWPCRHAAFSASITICAKGNASTATTAIFLIIFLLGKNSFFDE